MTPTVDWAPFSGRWILRTANIDDHDGHRSGFIIRGSQGSDGTYYPRSEKPALEIEVSGDQWQVQLLRLDYGIGGWHVALAHRTTTFEPSTGLQVDLDSRLPHSGGAAGHLPGMRLRCEFDDPATKTPDPGDPFDFTLPERK